MSLRRAIALACVSLALASPAAAADRGADGVFEARQSRHFLLLQDVNIDQHTGARGSRRFEREVLDALERSWSEVGAALGIEPRGRTRVIVYDTAVYDRDFARLFGFRSAGFFDGTIHVRAGTAVDARLSATLRHEYVHAALAGLDLPAWLGEGLAEYFERSDRGRGPSPEEVGVLRGLAGTDEWLPIESLSDRTFAGFEPRAAQAAYLQSLALVTHLTRVRGERALGRMCRDLARGSLERALKRHFGLSPAELEAAVLAGLGSGR